MECRKCGKEIKVDEKGYQVLSGYVGDDDSFEVEQGEGFYHRECLGVADEGEAKSKGM